MTAEARQWRNTLRWSTNGDFFQTFGSTMGFVPKRHQLLPSTGFYPVCSPIYSQKHHLQGSLPMFVLQCRSTSHLTYFVSFHRVHPSYATIQSYSHLQFIQSYKSHSFIHTLIPSHINAYTTYTWYQFLHGCISHPNLVSAISLQFSLCLSLCQNCRFQQTNSL